MSNVLIGIIGVILFIGLALAGALFLGPRFQETSNSSRASAAVQAVKQVGDAASMYRMQEGTPLGLQESSRLVSGRYLKSIPLIMWREPFLIDENGCAGCAGSNAPAHGVGYYLGIDDDAKRVCEAVARQIGQIGPGESFNPVTTTMKRGTQSHPTGCALVTTRNEYYVFTFL